MKKDYGCKKCDFRGTGPTSLGKHFEAFPEHRLKPKQRSGQIKKSERLVKCNFCVFEAATTEELADHYKEMPTHRGIFKSNKPVYKRKKTDPLTFNDRMLNQIIEGIQEMKQELSKLRKVRALLQKYKEN